MFCMKNTKSFQHDFDKKQFIKCNVADSPNVYNFLVLGINATIMNMEAVM